MRSLIIFAAILACVLANGNNNRNNNNPFSNNNRKTQLRNRYRQNGADCSFTSTDGAYEIDSKGNSGQVKFTRNVPRRRGNGVIKKSVLVFPYFLEEVDPNNQTVKRAGGFNSAGTSVTWNCGVGTETTVDASGNEVLVDVLQSDWSASRDIWTRSTGGVRQPTTVKLGFNVRLFSQTWVLDLCPRKYNGTGFSRAAFYFNSTNCSAVEVPGAGLKWSMLIENWPYSDAANHLELGIRLVLGNQFRSKNNKKARGRLRARRQAALQLVDFGDGTLENPEEVQKVCQGGTTDEPLTIINEQVGRSAQVDIRYIFPSNAVGCNFYYDPVMTMGDTTNGVGGRFRLSFVVVGVVFAAICGLL